MALDRHLENSSPFLIENFFCGVSAASAEKKSPSKTEVKFKKGEGADPNRPPCKKAKLLRLERKQQKLLKRGMSLEKIDTAPQAKTLSQFLSDIPKDAKHKLTVSLFFLSARNCFFVFAK